MVIRHFVVFLNYVGNNFKLFFICLNYLSYLGLIFICSIYLAIHLFLLDVLKYTFVTLHPEDFLISLVSVVKGRLTFHPYFYLAVSSPSFFS